MQKEITNINIAGINIDALDQKLLIGKIEDSIRNRIQIAITYCNARTVNYVYGERNFTNSLSSFEIVHPDGIGIFLASKFLYGKNGLHNRFSGSDFYDVLIKSCITQKHRVFFFGHDNATLNRIGVNHPDLIISGFHNGYDYNEKQLPETINSADTDILICGIGFPAQDKWVLNNRRKLKCSVILCVGEGIKVFSGSKVRGPAFIRKLGLEWFVRFLSNPLRYFRRYIIGNPLFLYRIIVLKMRNLRG